MCEQHDRDPENSMRQLVSAAMNSPERLGDLLDIADCPDCARQVLERFAFTFAGYVMDTADQPTDEPPPCTCARPVPAEAVAMRLAMTDPDDTVGRGIVLGEFLGCDECVARVIVAQACAQQRLLDGTEQNWRPAMQRELFALLDEQR